MGIDHCLIVDRNFDVVTACAALNVETIDFITEVEIGNEIAIIATIER